MIRAPPDFRYPHRPQTGPLVDDRAPALQRTRAARYPRPRWIGGRVAKKRAKRRTKRMLGTHGKSDPVRGDRVLATYRMRRAFREALQARARRRGVSESAALHAILAEALDLPYEETDEEPAAE